MLNNKFYFVKQLPRFLPVLKNSIRILAVIFALILLSFIFIFKYSSIKRTMDYKDIVTEERKKYIERVVERCLEESSPTERNKIFQKYHQLSLQPLRINTVSAVFFIDNVVLKRAKIGDYCKEAEIGILLSHKNLMSIYHFEKTSEILYLITEYCNIKISQSYVNRNEEIIRDIMEDILHGLDYLHKKNIAHLDLKVANIMGIKEGKNIIYKIIDYGFARYLYPSLVIPNKSYGTYPYKSPEIVFENRHSLKSDIWCIGFICWILVRGHTPFYRNGKKLRKEWHRFLENPNVEDYDDGESSSTYMSEEIRDFIELCLQHNDADRPSAEDLLNHKFIKQNRKRVKRQYG